MMQRHVVCLYITGAASAAVEERFGTYVDWFRRLFAAHDLDVVTFNAIEGKLPELSGIDAIVATGSPASLAAPEPWMSSGEELIRRAHDQNIPFLGVCFGHQMIGTAIGGRVVTNPRGWQLTTGEVSLTEDGRSDPLFANLPHQINVNLCHRDIIDVDSLPDNDNIRVLAGNRKAAVQAIALGRHIRGVQFHPEFSGAVTATYVESRSDLLTEDAHARQAPEDLPENILPKVADCPDGEQVMHNFLRHFVLEASQS